jgi:hypothetical protein
MPKLSQWRLSLIKGSSAVRLGTLEAADADRAVKAAIKKFDIKDADHQKRVVAQRVE